jgi:hypothetical protein
VNDYLETVQYREIHNKWVHHVTICPFLQGIAWAPDGENILMSCDYDGDYWNEMGSFSTNLANRVLSAPAAYG